ncbi:MAG: M48 family metalloprotease [Limnochordia bacterium]
MLRRQQFFYIVFLFLLLTLASGSASVFASLGTNLEVMIGQMAYEDLVNEYGGVAVLNPEAARYLENMFEKIVQANPRQDIAFSVTPLNSSQINAFALPGGFVFVTRGLLNLVEKPEELAGVLGHEVAHISHRHGMNAIIRQLGLVALARLLLGNVEGDTQLVEMLAGLSINLLKSGWSREAEFEADSSGVKFSAQAGFDPGGLVSFLQKMKELEGDRRQDLVSSWFATHPPTDDRISKLGPLVGEYRSSAGFSKYPPLPYSWF